MPTDHIATIAELWRYPVKGMRGERLAALDLDAHGIAGDRRFGFRSSGAPRGKPLLTGAERAAMLLYTASGAGAETRVTGPDGETFRLDDRLLIDRLQDSLPGSHTLSLVRSETPLTDVRPVAMVGAGTLAQLAREFGAAVDPRRFRANILLDLPSAFAEDGLAGRRVAIGPDALLRVTERVPRCRIVTLDPETAAANPGLMKHLDRYHEGRIGMYATVLRTGRLRVGDAVRPVEAH